MTTETEEMDIVTLEAKREECLSQARGFKVLDAAGYEKAANLLKIIKSGRDFCAKPIEVSISAAHKAHKAACSLRDMFLTPFDNADTYVRKQMVEWKREEQRKADEAARLERERLQREADEAARLEQAQKQTEAETLAAQAAEETDPVMADMLAYQATEAQSEAVAIASKPAAPIVQVVAAPVAPKVAGITDTVTWSFEVTDLRALLTAVMDGKAPIEYLSPNLTVIGAQVRKDKERFACPGIVTKSTAGIKLGRGA